MDQSTLTLAEVVWDYLCALDTPQPADLIVALGTNDLRVAEFAAGLWKSGLAPRIVCSGAIAHQGDLLETPWDRTEAEVFAETAERCGVPRDAILLEPRAANTSENIRFARALVEEQGIAAREVLFAVKPFMGRRVRAAVPVYWPEVEARVVSWETTLRGYFTAELDPEKITNIMMGDLQRVWLYAQRGWSSPQELPPAVRNAYNALVELGYTRHLIPE